MNIKIADLMAKRVIVVQPHHAISHARKLMERNRISALPVVGPENQALGIITTTDLARRHKEETPCGRIMSDGVHTVPAYNDVSIAARIMRTHKIHHVVITKEKCVVGIVSSFDLLRLIEGKRFASKKPSTPSKATKKVR